MIPLAKQSGSSFSKLPDIPAFFQLGWELFSASGTGIHQQVIRKLSSEEGARMVAALVEIMEQSSDIQLLPCFNKAVLPFYLILSHPDVVSSLILEQSLGTIYNILYGLCGRRAIIVYQFTSKVLEIGFSDQADKEIDFTIAIGPCLNVLGSILECNQAAQILEELLPAIETISAAANNGSTSPETQRQLDKIRARLGLGSLIRTMTRPNIEPAKHVCFELSRDLPGELSQFGPRHDNDHHLIENIQILPTAQEMQSDRTEYLPLSDPNKSYYQGLRGLLDRQFRLRREESVGVLRDAVGRELEALESTSAKPLSRGSADQKERTNIYRNVKLVKWDIDRKKGLRLVVEFDQPIDVQDFQSQQRKDWWQNNKRLQAGTLICLATSSGRTVFLLVEDPLPTPPHIRPQENDDDDGDPWSQAFTAQERYKRKLDEAPSLSNDRRRATVMLRLVQNRPDDVAWTLSQMTDRKSSIKQSLVEFPGALLQSFQPPLEALQMMSRRLDTPFRDLLAPGGITPIPKVEPAAYAQAPRFSYDLSSLTHGAEMNYSPGKEFDYESFNTLTDLDRAQQNALIHTLSNSLALVQGPPGTGKSYTGVAIIKTLLGNRSVIDPGPIICVCYTNHALDQLLEHLIKDGVDKIIRIGSRSKSEVLQNLNLNFLTQQVEQTKTEKSEKWRLYQDLDRQVRDFELLLDQFHSFDSISHMHEEGFESVKRNGRNNLKSWLRGSSSKRGESRSLEVLIQSNLWGMSSSERRDLHRYWTQQRSNDLIDKIIRAWDSYQETSRKLKIYTQEQQRRCLLEAKVVGVTTTGLARNLDVLRRLQSKILVNEEAGEVLEAHTLTALLPTVQHAILIGDHEQLRPQVKNYELRQDHPQGAQYSLDISLFERLVRPKFGGPVLQYASLKTQRRMHPSIAELVRNTIYPNLEDHPTVSLFPPVTGMQERLFWLNHNHCEESSDPMFSKQFSKTNNFEVEMTSALVSHLVRQGTYPPGDITVLTPYLGQLQKLKRLLSCSFDIVMSDRDVDDLQAQGFDLTSTRSEAQSSINKSSLLNAVRVATVDNFQGEEAKVIILSIVRSNEARKCGFLNSSNRINVALSRARHGMFIIGNATTASSITMWSDVISMLKQSNNFGDVLPLLCPRHPDKPIEIELDANPCIIPDCGHIITLENLDGLMSMKDFYEYDERGERITGIKSSSEPFSISGQKNCPSCRGPLRNINRYGRITRRAWIDEATKKFIVWANAEFVPLAAQVKATEEQLKALSDADTQNIRSSMSRWKSSGSTVDLTNNRTNQMYKVRTLTEGTEAFQSAIKLRSKVKIFFDRVNEKEQPFSQIYNLVQDARRHRGIQHNMAWTPEMLQTRHRLLASVMLLRCDYAILATFLAFFKGTKMKTNVKFSLQRRDCVALVNECRARDQPANEVEGHLFFARFIALERGFTDSMPQGSPPLISAHQHLDEAEALCTRFPGQTAGMASEVDYARTMLRDSTFYLPVSNEEKAQVYAAMAADFQGTGHWYYCVNGHPFTIGECGAPMQTSRCPQCGEMVGGEHHQLAEGITRAGDLEAQFGALRV
ncbi:MAG: hypothetical protein Q9167_004287 [Letrouitia subvulpina]